jgi:leucyl/phenylalanyl-tRNA--protein transferase
MLPPSLLLDAYASGWFPMGTGAEGVEAVEWFSPDPRALIPLDGRFHVSQRLARVVRSARFAVRVDTAFTEVVRACAERDETWITGVIATSYAELHRLGFAHSVEVWREDRLVGGLYGVALRGAFFGESMFHRETDASKVALCALVERLRARGYVLLDTQWVTEHLAQFGAYEVPRRRYLRLLDAAMRYDCAFAEGVPEL